MIRRPKFKVDPVVGAKLHSKSKAQIPIIVRFKNGDINFFNNKASNMSADIKYNLPLVGGIACNMNLREIEKLSNDPDVEYISFDSKVFALMDIAGKTISSKFPHEKGFTGKNITVAVIDTGVTPHNDLVKPKNRIVGFKDFVNGKNKPYDDNGHGTHVAGIIAGNGYASNKKYSGIAPEANILAVKALDESGSGNTSDIVSAIEWVIETKDVYDTKILNLSLGSPATNPYSSDPLARAAEEAVRAGITVVAAAGNSGPSAKTILCPGNSPSVITVGAIDDNKTPEPNDDFIAPFSSRGPTKDGIKKPDVVAPGVDIMSLSNTGSNYVSLSGTSMATPVVSGSCCLLYQKAKKITPSQVKNMLKKSCNDLKESNSDQGSGVINLKNLFEEDINNFPVNEQPKSNGFFNENIIIFLLLILLFSGSI